MRHIFLIVCTLLIFSGCLSSANKESNETVYNKNNSDMILEGSWININGISHGNLVINTDWTFVWTTGADSINGRIEITNDILIMFYSSKTEKYKYKVDSSGILTMDLLNDREKSYTLYFQKM